MAWNNNKKKEKNNAVVESYGKTEPVSNWGGETEPIFTPGNTPIGEVPPTMPVPSGLIDTDAFFKNPQTPTPKPEIQTFTPTEPADIIEKTNGEKVQPVVGWLVCIKGPNVGKEYRIHSDYNYVGSAKGDIVIAGDPKISHERHMLLTYDPENRSFYVSPAAGANIVRLNDKGLIGGGEQLKNYDVIRTGDTSLIFIGLCGPEFGWEDINND